MFFFKVFKILCRLPKLRKIEQVILGSEIIAFELVPLDTRIYLERILVIGCQYVNKQSQNFRYN